MTVFRNGDESPVEYFDSFEAGDFGECSPEERKANERAIREGGPLTAVYRTSDWTKLSVRCHGDRSVVVMTVLNER